jgi:NAD(P)-dependent dehydrogenase (short-subunit alcohol dehydrogenase family)
VSQKLHKKVVIVTGATSGIGAGIARLFAGEGAKVIVNVRDSKKGESVVEQIKQDSGEATFVACDISTAKGNELLVEKAKEIYGGVDMVVLSAGMLGLGSVTEVPIDVWHETMNINLNSIFYLLRKAIPVMKSRGAGNIVIIGSIAAVKAFPNHAAYCASKGALVPLVKQIALDYGPTIRVNLIQPGPVDTPLLWDSAKAFPDPSRAVSDAGAATIIGRLGIPDDIAQAALFLASEQSSYITGSVITADGGITCS